MEVGTIAVALSAVPVAVGCRRALEGWRLALWVFVTFVAAENLLLRVMAWNGHETGLVAWLAYPVSLGLGVMAVFAFPTMAPFRLYRWPVMAVFLLAWSLAPIVGDRQDGYSLFVAPLHALLLTGLGVWLWHRATGSDRVLGRPPVVAAAALVLTYGPFLLIWPVSVFLVTVEPTMVLPMWEARAGLLAVGSLLYAGALW